MKGFLSELRDAVGRALRGSENIYVSGHGARGFFVLVDYDRVIVVMASAGRSWYRVGWGQTLAEALEARFGQVRPTIQEVEWNLVYGSGIQPPLPRRIVGWDTLAGGPRDPVLGRKIAQVRRELEALRAERQEMVAEATRRIKAGIR